MNKPKGKVPSLICGSNGKPTLEQLSRASSCKRCKSSIPKGSCFKIPQKGSGYTKMKPYCVGCFRAILDKSRSDMEELEKVLSDLLNRS